MPTFNDPGSPAGVGSHSGLSGVTASQHHTELGAGVAKIWVVWQVDGTADASYNLTSITDTAAGNWIVNIANNFSTANYAVSVVSETTSGGDDDTSTVGDMAAGTFQVHNWDIGTVGLADPNDRMHAIAFGTLA